MLSYCALIDHRAHGGCRVARIAKLVTRGFVDQIGNDFIHLAFVNQHATWRMAGLSGVEETALDVPACGLFQIGVHQDDVCGFAAQFKRYPFDRAGRRFANPGTSCRRPREGDHVHVGMTGQCRPNLASLTDYEVEYTLWNAGLFKDLGEYDRR